MSEDQKDLDGPIKAVKKAYLCVNIINKNVPGPVPTESLRVGVHSARQFLIETTSKNVGESPTVVINIVITKDTKEILSCPGCNPMHTFWRVNPH